MAVQDRIRRNQQMQTKTFVWVMQLRPDNCNLYSVTQISPLFHFCGYCCHFYCEPLKESKHCDNNFYYMVAGLRGYASPFENNVTCYYSITAIDDTGRKHFSKRNTMQIFNQDIHEVFFKDFCGLRMFKKAIGVNCMFFYFSWYENVEGMPINVLECVPQTAHRLFSHKGLPSFECATQTEDILFSHEGMPTNVLECATQTEDILFSHEVNSIDVNEHLTQAESTQSTSEGKTYTNEENKTYKFLEILSHDLGNFYEGNNAPDCILNVGETKFPVHRSFLSARSAVFAAMFRHDTTESRSGEVNITDVDAAAFSDIIYYMYTGKVRKLTPDTAALVYTAADKYALIELKEECLDFLMNNLTLENIFDAAVLSHSHAEAQLEKEVVEFIKNRFRELVETENWKNFSDRNHKLANKLLCSVLFARETGKI